jgi:hypothetical protein
VSKKELSMVRRLKLWIELLQELGVSEERRGGSLTDALVEDALHGLGSRLELGK